MQANSNQLQSINPSNGSVVWTGSIDAASKVRAALASAREAWPEWASRTIEEREGILRRFSDILESRTEEMADLIAREIGKPLWEARTEVAAMKGKVEISIRAQRERCASFPGGKAVTRFRPHGVLGVIGPYNFPGHLPNGHICPALLAGNAVLFKPSELAPATGDRLVDYWHQAGIPGEVLQVLQGPASTAISLTTERDLDGVLFTGSASTGKLLAEQFAETPGKVLALEMGGNNPLIVDSGHLANLGAAVQVTVKSAFISAGQRCTCARRLVIVESGQSKAFLEQLREEASQLRIGDPFAEPEPFMGPLASPAMVDKVLQQQNQLLQIGAQTLLRAKAIQPGTGFITAGMLDVSEVASLPDEEIFAPFLQVIRVPDLESAVSVANETRFGLASGLLSDSRERYDFVYPRLRAGIINWNTQLTGASSAAPFGGVKDSGNLRPSAFFAADYCSYPVASMESPGCGK